MHPRAYRIVFSTALVALLVGACGSGGGGTPSAQAPASASTPVTSAPPTGSVSSPASTPATGSPAASAPASVSTGGAVSQPAGSPCEWLDKATIDATLHLNVGTAIPSGGDTNGAICTWLSKAPAGGLTLTTFDEPGFAAMVTNYNQLPGGRLVPGLGVNAVAVFATGQKAPLPNSHAHLFVDYGGWVLSVDVSGPTVTVDEAAALAVAVVNQ